VTDETATERRARQSRKNDVFHIMYGEVAGAKYHEMEGWRTMCAEYINGDRDTFPISIDAYRKEVEREERVLQERTD
jgi:hypothetical protein